MRKTHKDVEFAVHVPESLESQYHDSFAEAVTNAVIAAIADGRARNVDVIVSSRSGARWWAGEDGVDEYNEDPEASVFDRIVIRADSEGRVP